MAEPRIPSLQHLVRNWHPDPYRIQSDIVQLVNHPPRLTYNPLYGATRDYLVLRVSYEQIVRGIIQGVKRERARDMLLSVLPLIREYFEKLSPDFVQSVGRRFYPVCRGLMVPFEPPLVYGIGGQLYFPWFSFWRRNPISNERLSLFVTLVDEILLQDPDLENARFDILDFSAPKDNAPRKLRVIDAREIPRVSERREIEMLEIFAEGFLAARKYLATGPHPTKNGSKPDDNPSFDQPDLFR